MIKLLISSFFLAPMIFLNFVPTAIANSGEMMGEGMGARHGGHGWGHIILPIIVLFFFFILLYRAVRALEAIAKEKSGGDD